MLYIINRLGITHDVGISETNSDVVREVWGKLGLHSTTMPVAIDLTRPPGVILVDWNPGQEPSLGVHSFPKGGSNGSDKYALSGPGSWSAGSGAGEGHFSLKYKDHVIRFYSS